MKELKANIQKETFLLGNYVTTVLDLIYQHLFIAMTAREQTDGIVHRVQKETYKMTLKGQ